ncbi:unnamed protein product [Ostreobium quekettii]|uniref:Uncharacterized protein n=1 Tax=Ostreobium quekettii TaxID=121088 RepID=A0A8S1JDC9_9CHLO|nr:unnamed protein product [Ostreobium quekettii]
MMSLEDFVNSPLAEELLHNAMTLQLLGLTDNSYWPEAAEVRHCAKRHRSVQQRLVPVAKGVLSSVFHVSMTSRLDESLLSMAAMLGRDLRKPAFRGKPAYVEINSDGSVYWGQRSKDPREMTDAELAYWLVEAWDDWSASRRVNRYVGSKPTMRDENEEDIEEGLRETAAFKKRLKLLQTEFLLRRRQGMGQSLGTLHPMKYEGNTTVSAQGLWTTYENCVKGAQSKNKLRKVRAVAHLSTPDERVPMFTKPARAKIPQRILDTIRQKNLMDAELFEWGTQLFEKQLLDLEERGITMEGLRTSSKMAPPQESWLGSWFESKTAKFFMPSIIACVVFLGMVPLGVCVGMLRRVVGRDRDSWKSE